MSIKVCPEEILEEIFSYCGMEELMFQIPLVCKEWRRFSEKQRLWNHYHPERKIAPYRNNHEMKQFFVKKLDGPRWNKMVTSNVDPNRPFFDPTSKFTCLFGLGENQCVRVIETSPDQFNIYFSYNYQNEGIKYNSVRNYFKKNPTHKKIKIKNAGVGQFDSYDRLLSCACSDGFVRLIDTSTSSHKVVREFGTFGGKSGDKPYTWDHRKCTASSLTDNGKKVFGCGINHSVKLFDIETGKTIQDMDGNNEVEYHSLTSSKYSYDLFAVGCSNQLIEIWNISQQESKKPMILSFSLLNGQTIYPHRSIQFIGDYFLAVATKTGGYDDKERNLHIYDLRKFSTNIDTNSRVNHMSGINEPVKIYSTFCGDRRGSMNSIFFDDNCSKGIGVCVYGSISLFSYCGTEFKCLNQRLQLPFSSGMNDVHFAGNGEVFAISYSNPQSDWFGCTGVIYDGRRGKRKGSRNDDEKSKCLIQ